MSINRAKERVVRILIEMEKALVPHLSFLELVVSASKIQRTALLKSCSNDQLHILCEIALNIYKGNTLDRETLNKLRPHVSLIRTLVDRKLTNSVKIKRMVRNIDIVVLLIRPFLTMLESGDTDTSH
ncbi:hypothetical protein JV46_29760 [Solemya velum gill symbiont]|uniref:Uncharacterized protein n=1 Tax=Solemya velum gill symbiont TaxID=2340 RepID=A0A0B0H5Q7_SOVGS|nr:hypothetical protein JV46_29760 [Solemya velum gill symbiont]